MMSSVSGVRRPTMHQNLQATLVLKTQQQSHYDGFAYTASKEANLKFGSLSHMPSQMSNSERIKVTNPKVHPRQQTEIPDFKVKDEVQTTRHEAQDANEAQGPETGSGRDGSVETSHEEAEKVEKVAQRFVSKYHLSVTVSSSLSSVSGTGRKTPSPSFPSAHTPAITADTRALPTVVFAPTSLLHHTKSAAALKPGESVTSQDDLTPSEVVTGSSQTAEEEQTAETGFQVNPALSQAGSEPKEGPTETSAHASSASAHLSPTSSSSTSASSAPSLPIPLPTFSSSASSSPSSTQSDMKTQLPKVTLPSNTSITTELRFPRTEHHSLTMNATSKPPPPSVSLSRRPVCPYPPVPAHGTFYFRNIESPGPREYRHYIQYACYPGYTLAHGDIHSYCQQGGTWSGVTPVCLGKWRCCLILLIERVLIIFFNIIPISWPWGVCIMAGIKFWNAEHL